MFNRDIIELMLRLVTRWVIKVWPVWVLIATLASFALLFQSAQAQEARGLTVSPLIFELSANPGDRLTHSIKVDNVTGQRLAIVAEPRNFVALGEEGQPEITTESTPYSLASWITVTPKEAQIPPRGSVNFTFVVNPPLNAEPGGHFGSVVFKSRGPSGAGEVAVVQEVGALVLLKVAGQAVERASVETFKATPKFAEYGPVNFELRVRNQGNIHFKPTSAISITNMFGKEVAKLQYPSRNVLPDSIRKLDTKWQNKWLLGRYTAHLSLVYGSENQVLVAETSFWGFPYKIGLIVLGGLLALGVLLFLSRNRLKKSFRVLLGKE